MPVECHIIRPKLLFLTIHGSILLHSLFSWGFHTFSFPAATVSQPVSSSDEVLALCSSPSLLVPLSTHPPQNSLVPLLREAHLCRWLLSPYLELCPSYQAGAIDKKDDWSWAEDQCRRGENMGLMLAWEKEEGVTERRDSCSIHIFRAELLYLQCILRLMHIKNGNKPCLYWVQSDSSFLMGCSLPPAVTQSFSRSHRRPKEDLSLSVNMAAASLPFLHPPLLMVQFFWFSPFLPIPWFCLPLWQRNEETYQMLSLALLHIKISL